MKLAFFAADTLGVTFYQTKGVLKAHEIHSLPFGPWKVELPIEATSDIISGSEASFWVTLNNTLRCYAVVREKDNWLLVLKTDELKACGKQTGFSGTTVLDRLAEIRPAVAGVFKWTDETRWEQMAYDGGVATTGGS